MRRLDRKIEPTTRQDHRKGPRIQPHAGSRQHSTSTSRLPCLMPACLDRQIERNTRGHGTKKRSGISSLIAQHHQHTPGTTPGSCWCVSDLHIATYRQRTPLRAITGWLFSCRCTHPDADRSFDAERIAPPASGACHLIGDRDDRHPHPMMQRHIGRYSKPRAIGRAGKT